ncbi:MAG: 30S ribosomal protein S5 [Thermotogae bacterium]|uniref:Small ribosomal subunit protein uS5 n=1 Tax=Kosmotoga arenicorallina TaxID=688066 RepID=A0A7C5HNQ1_9BACT|nr:30S ribosomal protein S5 [Kosmotoga sp.]MBO8166483.1 30S ribosomal protein S5 [Kosmotoga sp.]MCD6160244.1 30S ribosomal protein S5 [Kosmotoga sp.]RKX51085.1 MAG: 30S ribosomal protein S5 [Thermotogota bacterium]HHF08166.1 30S ribosomal protein S5 [Kosmotoga arenicorallina]
MPEVKNIEKQIEEKEFEERIVEIKRVTKVVAGGKNLSFRVTAVVGNKNGKVGLGIGSAREVPTAIRKALINAKKNVVEVPVIKDTIPHEVVGHQDASEVMLKPAGPGTGIIASAGVRAVVELAGVKNILTKALGSTNIVNLARATLNGLLELKSPKEYAKLRDISVKEVFNGVSEEG